MADQSFVKAKRISLFVCLKNVPIQTYVGNSGWTEGLPLATEDWSNGERKRWTRTNYTQDNPNLSYILNPRPIETKVGDNANVRRTTINYHAYSADSPVSVYGLVSEVKVYDADQTTVLKRSVTNYNLDNAYLSRRIIGLVSESALYDADNGLISKVTYGYDEGNFSAAGQSISPIQHDTTSYGAGFVAGRGNLTSTSRWDANAPTDANQAVTSRVEYNTAGLPTAQIDPTGRTVTIGYTDSFEDNQNRSTYAYPTVLTDPAGNSSTVKYRYDIGANVSATSPAPQGNSAGKTTRRIYDALGRLERETIVNTGAYTRYEYPINGIQSKVFATVTDVNNNGADAADEVLSESFTDGAGRTRQSRAEHPGSSGGWSGTLTEYDVMGRVRRSSVPTEVDANWNPSGDDASRGWLWTQQEYDWKGRVTRTINTDGTDKLFAYEGCGCAGGQITTVSGEQLTEGRRTQKIYEDILGRSYKSETLNWDGTVYSTTGTSFNGRDQAVTVRQYAGAEGSGTYQDTTMTYDGHGRLKTQHIPQQDANAATTYNYNADESVQSVVDARGASTNYTYNNRKLVEQISYAVPAGSNIPVTPTVNFSYDNLGNRTQMTDGMGNVTYQYNQLSQLTAETRFFSSSLTDAPQSANGFTMSYAYHLGGILKNVSYPNGTSIDYNSDKTGKTETITGQANGQAYTFLSNIDYRSWGAPKKVDFGNGNFWQTTYNNRLLPEAEQFHNGQSNMVDNSYSYYADGAIKLIQDNSYLNNPPNSYTKYYDRLHKYDIMGRLISERSGGEALGTAVQGDFIKYKYDFSYDVWGNLKTDHKMFKYGSGANPAGTWNYNYTNNRRTGGVYTPVEIYGNGSQPAWEYDSDGRPTVEYGETTLQTKYDSAGRLVRQSEPPGYIDGVSQDFSHDGEGEVIKTVDFSSTSGVDARGNEKVTTTNILRYTIGSSMLGEAMVYESVEKKTYLNGSQTPSSQSLHKDTKTNIYNMGNKIAVQTKIENSGTTYDEIEFDFKAAFTSKHVKVGFVNGGTEVASLSTLGLHLERVNPDSTTERGRGLEERFNRELTSSVLGLCTMDGVYMPCDMAMRAYSSGAAAQCPNNDCGPQTRYFTNSEGQTRGILTTPFMAFANGISGHFYSSGMELGTPQEQADLYALAISLAERGITAGQLGGVLDGRLSFGGLQSQENDPCAKYLPSAHGIPPGVDIDNLINETQRTIKRLRDEARGNAAQIRKSGELGSGSAAGGAALAADVPGGSIDQWFQSMVARESLGISSG